MTNQNFKKIGRLLKELYAELEAGAIRSGVDIFGQEYEIARSRVRLALLVKMGYTLEEYVEAKERTVNEQKEKGRKLKNEIQKDILKTKQQVDKAPTREEMEAIAKKYIKKPIVTNNTVNKIVEKTTVEKPIYKTETIVEREEYDDRYIMAEIGSLNDRLENIPSPESYDDEGIRDWVRDYFGEQFEHNINTLDMPDWRKLAMGLQGQIDTKVQGIGVNRIFVSDTEPANPVSGDIWIDTDAYTYRAVTGTYTLTSEDYLIDCSGTFTVTLPTAVGFTGEYIIKNTGAGIVTMNTTGGESIDDNPSGVITLVHPDSLVVRSDGANWILI